MLSSLFSDDVRVQNDKEFSFGLPYEIPLLGRDFEDSPFVMYFPHPQIFSKYIYPSLDYLPNLKEYEEKANLLYSLTGKKVAVIASPLNKQIFDSRVVGYMFIDLVMFGNNIKYIASDFLSIIDYIATMWIEGITVYTKNELLRKINFIKDDLDKYVEFFDSETFYSISTEFGSFFEFYVNGFNNEWNDFSENLRFIFTQYKKFIDYVNRRHIFDKEISFIIPTSEAVSSNVQYTLKTLLVSFLHISLFYDKMIDSILAGGIH